jgi:membrane associated rhomboid family serine protease
LLLTGALISIFAIFFVLLGVVYALAVVIPSWGAALIVGGVLAGVGSAILVTSLKRLKRVNPTPEHTAENIKENIAWAKRHTK